MRKWGNFALTMIGAAVLTVLVGWASASATTLRAASSPVIVPIPGLSAAGLDIPAAQRTNTGGGVILADSGSDITLVRVLANGTPDLAYGALGLATVHTPGDFVALGLAVDPASGTAWISGSVGGRAQIISVGPTGTPETGFGTRGTLTLPAATSTVTALDFRAGALLVTGSNPECAGCQLTEVSPSSGHTLASRTLAVTDLTGTCGAVRDTGAVWSGSDVLIGTAESGSKCRAQTVEFTGHLAKSKAKLAQYAPLSSEGIRLADAGGQICDAGVGTAGISLWGAGQTHATWLTRQPNAHLQAIVPIGKGACAAMLSIPSSGSMVFQISAGGAPAAHTAVSTGFTAMTMYRCNSHLLVVGKSGEAGRILAIPLSQGPYVAAAEATRPRLSRTTGCS